jgi:hypothetical protein
MTASYTEMKVRTHVVGIERLERQRWRVSVDGRRLFTFCTATPAGSKPAGSTSWRRTGRARTARPFANPGRVRPTAAAVMTFAKVTTAACARSDPAPPPAGPREHAMDALTPVTLIHFYDTRSHLIACGASGVEHHSTKHARQVTCRACVALLGERPVLAAADTSRSASFGQ